MYDAANQQRLGLTAAGTSRPQLTDDYYTSDYVPDALLREWRAVCEQVYSSPGGSAQTNAVHPTHSPPQTRAVSTPATWSARSSIRRPQSSTALDIHFSARELEEQEAARLDGSGGPPPLDDNGDDDATSVGSAYRRHRRYENLGTAYQFQTDPYDRPREIGRQEQFVKENKRLARPFVVGAAASPDQPTRLMLGDCVRALYRTLIRDWREADPMVISTAEDLIVVYFSLRNLSKRQAGVVLSYMNASLRRNEAVRKYNLSKVSEGWDILTDDAHLMYTMRPPWVKKRVFLPDTIAPLRAHKSCGSVY